MSQPIEIQQNQRYQVQQELGSGGMGIVYQAFDRLTGQEVALKRLNIPIELLSFMSVSHEADRGVSLAREFALAASLLHPYIVRILDYGFDFQRMPYLVMELVKESQTLNQAVQHEAPQLKLKFLAQLLHALHYLHQRHIIHCDLKPSNVLVSEGKIKLVDFGLSLAKEDAKDLQGTLPYIAPELLLGQNPTPLSDLYAFGVMAYELFSGQLPFYDGDLEIMTQDILTATPDMTLLEASQTLKDIIGKLLHKEPEHRYASAIETIAALTLLLDETDQELPAIRESFLQAASFVGREAELSQLQMALEQTIAGSGSSWLIAGESGVGKSRLLEELRITALTKGALVLRGQAVEGGGVPYQILRDPLQLLLLYCDPTPDEASALKTLIPHIESLLGSPVADATPLEGRAASERLNSVIVGYFRRQTMPIILILEDLHWAVNDLDILQTLNRLMARLPLLIVGSYRDDESPDLPRQLPGMGLIKLERLSLEQTIELSASIIGEQGRDSSVVNLLQRETEGNVLFIIEVLRALANTAGRLTNIGVTTLPNQIFAGGIRQVMIRRLQRVSDEALALLKLAAVQGRQLDLDILRTVSQQASLDQWLEGCANAAIIDFHDGYWRFAHDKLRETLIDLLTPLELQALHLRLATALEHNYGETPTQAGVIASHWGKAGNIEKEAEYALLAGEYALSNNLNRQAETYLQRVLTLLPEDTRFHTLRCRANLLLGRVKISLGNLNDAQELLEKALALADDMMDRRSIVETLSSLGTIQRLRGSFDQAKALFERSLQTAREAAWREGISRALTNLGTIAQIGGQYEAGKELLLESARVAQEIGWIEGTAQPLNTLGIGLAQIGQFDEAERYLYQCLNIYQKINHKMGGLRALTNLGVIAAQKGNFDEAAQRFQAALETAEELDEQEGMALLHSQLGRVHLDKNELEDGLSHLNSALKRAMTMGLVPLTVSIIFAFAKASEMQGDGYKALTLTAFVLHHPMAHKHLQQEAQKSLDTLQDTLGQDLFLQAVKEGRDYELEGLVQELLSSPFRSGDESLL